MHANVITDRARPSPSRLPASTNWQRLIYVLVVLAALPVVGLLIWQGVTSSGSPDPTSPNTSHLSAILDTSVLVFREGLESILVLAAITAGLSRKQERHGQPDFPRRQHADSSPRSRPGSSCAASSTTSARTSPISSSRPPRDCSPSSCCSW